MLTRREVLIGSGALAVASSACARPPRETPSVVVNDVHSRLNATRVSRVLTPRSTEEVVAIVRRAVHEGRALSIAGARHAMGGQQFGAGTWLLDMSSMARIVRVDRERGAIEVEAGIQWPALMAGLLTAQRDGGPQWGIVQKQTGADALSIGGAVAANVHGRGLALKPFIDDIEAFTLVDGRGEVRRCSRDEHPELFRLAVGGYGLLGVVTAVTLRLTRRRVIERVVEVIDIDGLTAAFDRRIADGFLFGDFQFATDERAEAFLRRGVFSCYRPVDGRAGPDTPRELELGDWQRLLILAHTDKTRAFEQYAAFYRATSGQTYWSDTHQLSLYVEDYHAALDRQLGAPAPASEMISEIYVPRPSLTAFMRDVAAAGRADAPAGRADAPGGRAGGMDIVYGTVRLIARDDESVLAWARQPWACIIFNLHVVHTPDGLARGAAAFRRLIDLAMQHGGSYYLTYHRWAARGQVEACHPRFVEFLRLKRRWDREERFQSDWYRHYRAMFADVL